MTKKAVGFLFMLIATGVFGFFAVYAVGTPAVSGISYDAVMFGEVRGNPFGSAAYFNAFVLENCTNPAEIGGALAVGGSLYAEGDVEVGSETPVADYNNTRLIVQGDVYVRGFMNTYGNVLAGGEFSVGRDSVYILPALTAEELKEIDELYSNADEPWQPTISEDMTEIISQSSSMYISAGNVGAKLRLFFEDAEKHLIGTQNELMDMQVTGEAILVDAGYILQGNEQVNVFELHVDGSLGGIEFATPEHSVSIVNIYGVNEITDALGNVGYESKVVFNFMSEQLRCSAEILGSVLAPNTTFVAEEGCALFGNFVARSLIAQTDLVARYFPFNHKHT